MHTSSGPFDVVSSIKQSCEEQRKEARALDLLGMMLFSIMHPCALLVAPDTFDVVFSI